MIYIDINKQKNLYNNITCACFRWWQRRCSALETLRDSTRNQVTSLSIEDTAGVFIVLGAGMILSLLASVVEHFKVSRKKKMVKRRVSVRYYCTIYFDII